ncbi:MAG: potassium channel family protein [Candidatus Micrarchaeia archaeon]
MKNIEIDSNKNSFSFKIIIILSIITIIYTLFLIFYINNITNNFYSASYYVISSLFDAAGIEKGVITNSVFLTNQNALLLITALLVITGIIKILVVGILIAIITNTIYRLNIKVNRKRKLSKHIIICGYSDISNRVVKELKKKNIPFVIIEKDPIKADMAIEEGYYVINDNFTKDSTLENADIKTASSIIFLTEDNYNNLLGILTAKYLNNNIKVITSANNINVVNKMKRAGASLCIIPEIVTGIEMGDMLSRIK